eukprot:1675592-Pyramimonas_sp.AAC.1
MLAPSGFRRSKTAPKGAPRRPKGLPTAPQNCPKSPEATQEGPKTAQEGSRTTSGAPEALREGCGTTPTEAPEREPDPTRR